MKNNVALVLCSSGMLKILSEKKKYVKEKIINVFLRCHRYHWFTERCRIDPIQCFNWNFAIEVSVNTNEM